MIPFPGLVQRMALFSDAYEKVDTYIANPDNLVQRFWDFVDSVLDKPIKLDGSVSSILLVPRLFCLLAWANRAEITTLVNSKGGASGAAASSPSTTEEGNAMMVDSEENSQAEIDSQASTMAAVDPTGAALNGSWTNREDPPQRSSPMDASSIGANGSGNAAQQYATADHSAMPMAEDAAVADAAMIDADHDMGGAAPHNTAGVGNARLPNLLSRDKNTAMPDAQEVPKMELSALGAAIKELSPDLMTELETLMSVNGWTYLSMSEMVL